MSSRVPSEYLEPGHHVNSEAPEAQAFARDAVGVAMDRVERATRLFSAVRDGFWDDPFTASADPADGYTDLHLDGRWGNATPGFDTEPCARFDVFTRPGAVGTGSS